MKLIKLKKLLNLITIYRINPYMFFVICEHSRACRIRAFVYDTHTRTRRVVKYALVRAKSIHTHARILHTHECAHMLQERIRANSMYTHMRVYCIHTNERICLKSECAEQLCTLYFNPVLYMLQSCTIIP